MRYQNVLLVLPRYYKGVYRLSILPPAGLGYIAEALNNAGVSSEVLDMNLHYDFADLCRKIVEFKPDLIGFSIMTFGHKELYRIINETKKKFPYLKIVVGGPHVSMLRGKVLEDCLGIDYGIILEGDLSIIELCKGNDLESIQGFIFRDRDKVITNNFGKFITSLDSLNFPKYTSFELDKYPTKQIGIVTSRGCPYDCIYCPVNSAIGKQFRYRSDQNIISEIEFWYLKGYKEILILDDNFTLLRSRVEKLCDLLKEKNFVGLSLKCPNGIRADRVDYNLLKRMRQVGFDMLSFGVEAAEDRVLQRIKKGESISTIEEGIRNACDLGYDVDLFFLIGSPGESLNDLKTSFALSLRYPVRSARFYNIIPFPTTELFAWIKDNNYFLRSENDIINNASHFINEPCFFTPEMSAEDRRKAFKLARKVSKIIRRRFIIKKVKGPEIFKNLFGLIYASDIVENMLNNSAILVRIKEVLKSFCLRVLNNTPK